MSNLISLSIIPRNALRDNPTNIPYHNPRFPITRYNKIVCEHFFWKQVQLAEEMAKMNGSILVPSSCMNWRRKKMFAARAIIIHAKSFYVMKPSELTPKEKNSFLEYVGVLQESI